MVKSGDFWPKMFLYKSLHSYEKICHPDLAATAANIWTACHFLHICLVAQNSKIQTALSFSFYKWTITEKTKMKAPLI